jgi:hypothetical protein
MINNLPIYVLFALVSLNACAEVPLEGNLDIGGPVTNKGPPSPGKSHIYLNLNSDAAKALYNALDGVPTHDECTGHMFKGKGNVGCYEIIKGANYYCSFSINIDKGTIEAGMGGC